jgi:hypothetical protein
MTPEAKLKKLQDILKLVDESLTRDEFVKSFEAAIKLIVDGLAKINVKVDTKVGSSIANLTAEIEALKQSADEEFSTRRAAIKAEFDKMFNEQLNALNFLRDKARAMSSIPGPKGEPGNNGSPDTGGQIIDKINNADSLISKDSVDGLLDLEKKVDTMPRGSVGGAKGIGLLVGGAKKKLTAQTIDFTAGTNVTLTHSTTSGVDKITIAASGSGGGHTIQDEGSNLTARTLLNFVGAGVTVTDGGAGPDSTIVTIPGGAGSGITRTITNISGNTTAGSTASTDYVYNCTAALTLTLPTAVGNTNLYTVTRVSGLTTIATTAAQTINGSATATITINNMSLGFESDGSNWQVV